MIQEKDFKIRLVLTHGQLTGPLDLPTLLTNYSESRILPSLCCLIDFRWSIHLQCMGHREISRSSLSLQTLFQ